MRMEIQGNGIEINDSLRRFVSHRADLALRARADHIDSVVVHVADHGVDDDAAEKSCLIQVRLHGLPDVTIESTDANLYVAVHLAVDRAGWTVARTILRQHRKLVHALINLPSMTDGRAQVRAA